MPTACFLSASPTGNIGSQTKLEQRHPERLQAKVTVVMASAADSPPGFRTSLFLAVAAGRNMLDPDTWSPAARCSRAGGFCGRGLLRDCLCPRAQTGTAGKPLTEPTQKAAGTGLKEA